MYEDLVRNLRGMSRYTAGTVTDLCKQAADAIEDLSKPRWTSVTDEPPLKVGDEGYNGYLVYSCGYYEVADYHGRDKYDNKSYFYVDGEYDPPDVTHFMPLPEPPKEETIS